MGMASSSPIEVPEGYGVSADDYSTDSVGEYKHTPNAIGDGTKDTTSFNLDHAIREAWRSHTEKLHDYELSDFQSHAELDLLAYTKKIQDACQKQRERGRISKLVDWCEPLFETLKMYMPATIEASQAYPNPTSLILGGIMCITQISANFLNFQKKIFQTLGYMARKLSLIQRVTKQIFDEDKAIQHALTHLYCDVLDFCRSTYRLLVDSRGKERGHLKTFGISLIKTPEARFGQIIESFDANYDEFQEHVKAYDRDRSRALQVAQTQQGIHQQDILSHITSVGQAFSEHITYQRQIRMVESAKKSSESSIEKKRMIRKWLSSTGYASHYDRICEDHLEGTGQWLLQHPTYENWKAAPQSGLLWLNGKAGCGKSFLASVVVSDLEWEKGPDLSLAYVFCRDEVSAREPDRILAAILEQLFQQAAGLHKAVEDLYDAVPDPVKDKPTWRGMREATLDILSSFSTTYLVVDGIDECEDQVKVVRLLTDVVKAGNGSAKILALSRPGHRAIDECLMQEPTIVLDSGANIGDIKLFIEANITADTLNVGNDTELLEKVRSKILEKADGMFLYCVFMAQALQEKRTPGSIEEALENLPMTLAKVYQERLALLSQVLSRDDCELALRIIMYTFSSSRPLTEAQMLEALAITPGMTHLESRHLIPSTKGLVALCGNLVAIDSDGRFVLCHGSFNDYLHSSQLDHSMQALPDVQTCHTIFANVCLDFLMLDNFDNFNPQKCSTLKMMWDEHPFFLYALECWAYHASKADIASIETKVRSMLSSENRRSRILQSLLVRNNCGFAVQVRHTNPLHVLSAFGYVELLKIIPGVHNMLEMKDSTLRTPTNYAFMFNSRSMFNWILDISQRYHLKELCVGNGGFLMLIAAKEGWVEAVLSLIKQGFKVNGEMSRAGPLKHAIQGGRLDVVQELIKAGADVNLKGKGQDDEIALVVAIHHSQVEILELLLQAGSDINFRPKKSLSPLSLACHKANLRAIDALLKHGAHIPKDGEESPNIDAMHQAAIVDNDVVIEMLFKRGFRVDQLDTAGFTPLHKAAYSGSIKAVRKLLELGADSKIRRNSSLPIHFAAKNGKVEVVRYLLDTVDKDTTIDAGNEFDSTPLICASAKGCLDTTTLLLNQGAELNHSNQHGWNALGFAISCGHATLAKKLIDAGATFPQPDSEGLTALHWMAKTGLSTLVGSLGRPETSVALNSVTHGGYTALHLGIIFKHEDFVEELCKAYNSVDVTAKGPRGRTPVHMAAAAGSVRLVQYFLSRGASQVPDESGDLPLHAAVIKGNVECVQLLISEETINRRGANKKTALHCAVLEGSLEIVEKLLERGADCSLKYGSGETLILMALKRKFINIVRTLNKFGAQYKEPNDHSFTPLHVAAYQGDLAMVKDMLKQDCDPLRLTNKKMSAFSYAVQQGHHRIVDLFLKLSFNGSNQRYTGEFTAMHLAARSGSLKTLEIILNITSDNLEPQEVLGTTPLLYAAILGQVETLELLIQKGANCNTVSDINVVSVWQAARRGYLKTMQILLAHTNLNTIQTKTMFWGSNAIVEAARKRAPKSVKALLEAGADPYQPDVFGQNAFDYAAHDESTLLALLPHDQQTMRTSEYARNLSLRKAIVKSLRVLCEQDEHRSEKEFCIRYWNVEILMKGMIMMKEDARNGDATAFIAEILNSKVTPWVIFPRKCSLCDTQNLKAHYCVCRTCLRSQLCKICYQDVYERTSNKRVLEAKTEQEKIEGLVRPLAQTLQYQVREDPCMCVSALMQWAFLNDWIVRRKADYQKWRTTYGVGGLFKDAKLLGEILIHLLVDWFDYLADRAGELDTADPEFEELNNRFDRWKQDCKSDEEVEVFGCQKHEFLQITKSEFDAVLSDAEKFDPEKCLTHEWLCEALQHYEKVLAMYENEMGPGTGDAFTTQEDLLLLRRDAKDIKEPTPIATNYGDMSPGTTADKKTIMTWTYDENQKNGAAMQNTIKRIEVCVAYDPNDNISKLRTLGLRLGDTIRPGCSRYFCQGGREEIIPRTINSKIPSELGLGLTPAEQELQSAAIRQGYELLFGA